ncbi:MAG TPA: NUDIX domain-containing protein [Ramlibacter sp.]|nr:NUDIX domain-containing protein [Ramlibacter sp.]
MSDYRFCPACATPLQWITQQEDGGDKQRLRCPGCGWTHWNNPTPVLAAIIEYQGQVLLARNAAWQHKMYALITGFMEAGETPQDGITREIAEETSLRATKLQLIGVYDFQRMNQVIIAYHALCEGEVRLSPELAEYRLFPLDQVRCWPAGTGFALAEWLRSRGHEPQFMEWPRRPQETS